MRRSQTEFGSESTALGAPDGIDRAGAQADDDLMRALRAILVVPRVLTVYIALGVALEFFEEIVNQGGPRTELTSWLLRVLGTSLMTGSVLGVSCAILMAIDVLVTPYRGCDPFTLAYYPTWRGLVRASGTFPSRLILVVSGLCLTAWFTYFRLDVLSTGVIPPPYGFAIGLTAWAIAWYADCLARPQRTTVVAATCFLLVALLTLVVIGGMGGIRE